MKKVLPVIFACFFVIMLISQLASKKNYTYIGAQTCKKCHGSEAIGNQYKIWASSPHANAARLLLGEKALKIGQKVSVTNPSLDITCLKCHTTGRGKVKHTLNEGVGCESCHGPGSAYHDPGVHVNYIDRKIGYQKAIQNGMYPILWDHLKNREKLCLHCHNSKRPCFPESMEEIQKQKMTIQVIDKLRIYRNGKDINFRHPLRR